MSWQWNGRLKIAKAGLKSVLKPGFRSHHQMERWRCPEQAAGSREWQRIVLSSCVYVYISTGICLPRSRDGDAIIPCSTTLGLCGPVLALIGHCWPLCTFIDLHWLLCNKNKIKDL